MGPGEVGKCFRLVCSVGGVLMGMRRFNRRTWSLNL